MATVKNRLWLWCHPADCHYGEYGIREHSTTEPAEAALGMGIPNAIMVRYRGRPVPPFKGYAKPFRALDRVIWSIVAAGGRAERDERRAVLELARGEPNMTGVIMDDFFVKAAGGTAGAHEAAAEGELAALSLEELRAVRRELSSAGRGGRRLDLWVVLYDEQTSMPLSEHLALCDIVTFWTWRAEGIARLPESFAAAERLAPGARRVLGCYMWDYGSGGPMPLELMERQCSLGLEWLRSGRIDGMIFLASCICGLHLEAVEWTSRWIADHRDEELPV